MQRSSLFCHKLVSLSSSSTALIPLQISEPIRFTVDAPPSEAGERLGERTHWRAAGGKRWSRRLSGKVKGSSFKFRLFFPVYIAGDAVVEGELSEQDGSTLVEGRVRPAARTIVQVVGFLIGGLALSLFGPNPESNWLLGVLLASIALTDVIGYVLNKRHARALLTEAVSP